MKKNRIKPVLTLSLLLIYFVSFSQTNEVITENFFKTYKQSPTKAYEALFINNKWMKDKKSAIETVKIKLEDLLKDVGTYYGYELITEKNAGESYILKSYLIKYERQPLRFTFFLYKPNNEWTIQNFTYDTQIDDELSEAAKAYRLKYNW